MVCSNNAYISHNFVHTTTFTVYVTACRGSNLEKSFIIEKQLWLKTTDTLPFIYTHNVVNTSYSLRNKLERLEKTAKVTFKVTDIGAIR